MSHQTSRPSRRMTSSGQTTSSKRSGPYDANYELKLAQAGIFVAAQKDEDGRRIKPANYDEIATRLNQTRPSLSPSRFTEHDFENFQEQTEQEILESETMLKSVAVIEGTNGPRYSRMGGQFNNLDLFDPDLKVAMPDSYDGAPPLSIDHRVLNDLSGHIVPSTDTSRPAAPNFFLEGKSKKGRTDVAKRKAAYAGSIGARGMTSLQKYPTRVTQYDHSAYSFTNTYHDGSLKMYTTHATAPKTPGGPPQYHMTQLKAFAMTGDSDTFRKGATQYRNARDLAEEQRSTLIQQANQAARRMPAAKHRAGSRTTTITMSSMQKDSQGEDHTHSPDTDTSTDELALDDSVKRSRTMLSSHDEDAGGDDNLSRMSFTMSDTYDQAVEHLPRVSQRRPAQSPRKVRSQEVNEESTQMTSRMSSGVDSART